MKSTPLDVRFTAILQLQQLRSKFNPGSYQYEITDHAIDLALNNNRKVDKYLVRNVIRDSKRILNRINNAHPHKLIGCDINETVFTNIYDKSAVSLTNQNTPYRIISTDEFINHISESIKHEKQLVKNIIDGFGCGYTNKELASLLNISESTIKRVKNQVSKFLQKELIEGGIQ